MVTPASPAAFRTLRTNAVEGLCFAKRSAPMISARHPGSCGNARLQAATKMSGPLSGTTRPTNRISRSRGRRLGSSARSMQFGSTATEPGGASTPSRSRSSQILGEVITSAMRRNRMARSAGVRAARIDCGSLCSNSVTGTCGSRRASRSAISGRLCTSINAGDIRRSMRLAAGAKRRLMLPGQPRRLGCTGSNATSGNTGPGCAPPMITVRKPGVATADGRSGRSPRPGPARTLRAGEGRLRRAVHPGNHKRSRHRCLALVMTNPASFAASPTPHPPSGTHPYGGPPRSCRAYRPAGRHRAGHSSVPGPGARRLDAGQTGDAGGVRRHRAVDRTLPGQRADRLRHPDAVSRSGAGGVSGR